MGFTNALNGFIELAEKHGLATTVALAFLFFHYFIIWWLLKQTVKSKYKEIERLVENRNKLQDAILKQARLSTKAKKK